MKLKSMLSTHYLWNAIKVGVKFYLNEMPPRKISLSMKRAIVLNKGETDELHRRVGYLRKSRDEALMELKAERLRLKVKKTNESREEIARSEEVHSEESKQIRRPSLADRSHLEQERPKSLFPPLAKGFNKSNFQSLSEPSTPTNALEFQSPSQSDLRSIGSLPNYRSVRLRKLQEGRLPGSACSLAKDIGYSLSDSISIISDFRAPMGDRNVDKNFLSKHRRRTSRVDFDDTLGMLKMQKDSSNIAKSIDIKNSCSEDSVAANGFSRRKKDYLI